ncbi:Hypothetical predicted protein [Octopus vulgaris]|uniref:Helitron helicase-like domain-containing protein n=1 Tax=Octopus vulgaris TaxID=6645 RepID=A0AA36C146_OCTVU|nr:Hypothetical predicted protein [Octopus vulgaris]
MLAWCQDRIHPVDIDRIISAELPDQNADPQLHISVTKHMIHGPCGDFNPRSPCMKNKRCSKRYPRDCCGQTCTTNDGYPIYRRRDPGLGDRTATIRQRLKTFDVDNAWIVPFNPLLSKTFNAHINVEYCSSVRCIQYLCKYINKGDDMAVFVFSDEDLRHDEIKQFVLGRYVSSNYAAWRIFGYEIHLSSPTVFHLNVHLQKRQLVYFTEKNARQVNENPKGTTLTAFFKLCSVDEFAATLIYPEVPEYYTYNNNNSKRRSHGTELDNWPGVSRKNVIGRVYNIHPTKQEIFFLRMLLHVVTGPKSFADLRTVDGIICATYREACLRRRLLLNDDHLHRTLAEASNCKLPWQMRRLFCSILIHCNPSNPLNLWESFRQSLSKDIQANLALRDGNDDVYNEALIDMDRHIRRYVIRGLSEFHLPTPVHHEAPLDVEYMSEKNYNIAELTETITRDEPRFLPEQREIYNEIIDSRQRSRMTDTPVAREARLTAQRESTRMARLADTHDEREARLATDRIQAQQRNPNQTAEQTQVTRSIAQRKLKQNKAAKRDEFWYRAAFTYDPAKNYANNNKVTIGKMDKICSSFGAKKWDFDVPGLCCSQGKVRLPPLPDPPQVLLELLTSPSDGAKHFRERIHRFNSCFSMTCFGTTSIPGLQKNKNKQNMPRPSNVASTTTENLSVPGPSWTVTTTITENLNVPGPSRAVAKTVLENPHVDRHSTKPNYHSEKYEHFYTYKIHGQCYHQMGSLRPIPGKEPTFMQVFFVGGHDEELAIRKKNNPKLERRVIEVLQMMHHQTHPYVREFKNAMDTLDSQPHLKLVIHADKTPAVTGPKSFADLRTVDGIICATYREACLRRGLLLNDDHLHRTLAEASNCKLPWQMRRLFCSILIHCNPSNPLNLWESFRQSLSKDIQANLALRDGNDDVYNEALIDMDRHIRRYVIRGLSDFHLPTPVHHEAPLDVEYMSEKNYNIA